MSDAPEPERTAGGEPRASAPLVATVIALLAVVVMVAIASGGGGAPRGHVLDEEERALERARVAETERGRAVSAEIEVAPSARRILDAGPAGAIEAGSSTSHGVRSGPAPDELGPSGVRGTELGSSAETGATGAGSAASAPGRVPAPDITLAEEYEHTAFFLDILVLRRDTVRRDLLEARRIGDGPRIRRLEPDEAILEGEIARFNTRSHELEARMREGAEETPAPAAPEGL